MFLLPLFLTLLVLSTTLILATTICNVDPPNQCSWYNPHLSHDVRASSLLKELSVTEKINLLGSDSKKVVRLHVPAYAWWSEAAHGIAWAGIATVFPCSMGLAATFDPMNVETAGKAMSDEARAKHLHHLNTSTGESDKFFGLDFFAPNINIVKDIRWGRAQETYGEDPELTGTLGASFIRGIQQFNSTTQSYKTIATAKHFAAYNLESNFAIGGTNGQYRLMYDENVSWADLQQTYFPVFERAIIDGNVGAIMCSYNSVNSYPMCASPLLRSELRDRLHFQGYIISDDGAVDFMVDQHHWAVNHTMATAAAFNSGVDINLGNVYQDGSLQDAISLNLVTMDQVNASLLRVLKARIQMGMFEDTASTQKNPYDHIDMKVVDSKGHRELAKTLATESIVMLKNDNNTLPLLNNVKNILVVGPNANRKETLLSNYPGCKSGPGSPIVQACINRLVTPLDGLQQEDTRTVTYSKGVDIDTDDISGVAVAVELAKKSDVVIFVGGYITCQETGDQCIEAEAKDRSSNNNAAKKPKDFGTGLPSTQLTFLHTLAFNTTTPIVVVVNSGSGVSLPFSMKSSRVGAIIQQFYSGEQGGNALADIIYGKVSPTGRMPITVPQDASQLPANYLDSSMSISPGRTYRYLNENIAPPLFWFGDGLSYSTFQYEDLLISPSTMKSGNESLNSFISIRVTITNNGEFKDASDHVVMIFASLVPSDNKNNMPSIPKRSMVGFQRVVSMKPNETRAISIEVSVKRFRLVDSDGLYQVIPGEYLLWVGGANDPKQTIKLIAK
jgi:beta-glucosidase